MTNKNKILTMGLLFVLAFFLSEFWLTSLQPNPEILSNLPRQEIQVESKIQLNILRNIFAARMLIWLATGAFGCYIVTRKSPQP